MKINASAKKTAGRKILALALTFAMAMQFNCMALSTAWADTEEIVQEEQIAEVKEEVKEEAKAPVQTETKAEVKEVKQEAPKTEAKAEVKEEVKQEAPKAEAAPAETVKQEAVQEQPKEEVKSEAPAEEVKQETTQEVKEEQPEEEVKAEVQNEQPAEAVQEEVKAEDEKEAVDLANPPMAANQKALTGIRLSDGRYYGIAFTDTFKAIDSRYIPFGTKLTSGQYSAADYDFTNLVLNFNGKSYVYRPNGPQAGDGKNFCYYTTKFIKIDKLEKSTYTDGYLVDGWPTHWGLITNLKKDETTGLYKAGYYHRDYQVTFHTGDAPDAEDIAPMAANQKLLTGIRLGDGKAGNGDGKYYGVAFTDTFEAIDSRYIPFETKLVSGQYKAADYDFTNLDLTFKGKTYVYRPNGPQAGDGKDFCYYTAEFMKLDKLNKSTYSGGYLTEGWPTHWGLVNNWKQKDETTGLYKAGYYHRDYQVTLHIGDAPDADEPIIEEPTVEEPVIEEPVIEEPVIEEPAVEEPAIEEPTIEEPEAEETAVQEEVEELVDEIEEPAAAVDEIAEEIEALAVETLSEEEIVEIAAEESAIEEHTEEIEATAAIVQDDEDDDTKAPAAHGNHASHKPETVSGTKAMTDTATGHIVNEITEAEAPAAAPAEITEMIEEEAAPLAVSGTWSLLNLMTVVFSGVMSLGMLLLFTRRDHGYEATAEAAEGGEEETELKRKGLMRVLSLIPAIASAVIFTLTEDMSQNMVLADNWTALMTALLLITAAMAILSRKIEKEA